MYFIRVYNVESGERGNVCCFVGCPLKGKRIPDAAGTTKCSVRGFSTCPTNETTGISNLVESILLHRKTVKLS